jgi:peptide-methionine (S)-S-oxide reductase
MRTRTTATILAVLLLTLAAVGRTETMTSQRETATFAGGCFWCLEALFQQLEGVDQVASGFAGGGTEPVSYKQVCSGDTGHAEVVQITFDPQTIRYEELLVVFFSVHDPTTLNRQGADVGTQYRSAVFTHDDAQRAAVVGLIAELTREKVFPRPIVTQVAPLDAFIVAEDYHQDYYANNKSQPYCRAVIDPKLDKFRQKFADRLKD